MEFEIAAERFQREQQQEWLHGAFIGWQLAGVMGGEKVGTFKKYTTRLGLEIPGEKVTREKVAAEKARAFKNAEAAIRAFDGGNE